MKKNIFIIRDEKTDMKITKNWYLELFIMKLIYMHFIMQIFRSKNLKNKIIDKIKF